MATSTNYGWAEPDNSSLVKNGASDIRTLGNAIDASLWNVGYGQAGKNKIINGDFGINQRSFTTSTTNGAYTFDRWNISLSDGTVTASAQTFTTGAAPVAGYESTNYFRMVTTGQTATSARANLTQPIENVRTFAGQTVTISFWAKSASGTPKVSLEWYQIFGSGGSPSSNVSTYAGQATISTSWTRYSISFAVPSISGKTIGTTANTSFNNLNFWFSAGSDYNSRTNSMGIQSNTFDIWGVQVEAGSTATPFQTASGSIGGELALCQRYYVRFGGNSADEIIGTIGTAYATTAAAIAVPLPVTMRTKPASVEYSTIGINDIANSIIAVTSLTLSGTASPSVGAVTASVASGATQYRPYRLQTNNSTSGYVGFSAEL